MNDVVLAGCALLAYLVVIAALVCAVLAWIAYETGQIEEELSRGDGHPLDLL